MGVLISFLLVAAQWFWVIGIRYPISIEQLEIGIKSGFGLWLIRLISFCLCLLANHWISQILSKQEKIIFWSVILASPMFTVLWMSYPVRVIQIFVLTRLIKMWGDKKWGLFPIIIIIGVVLYLLNGVFLKENLPLFEEISLRRSQKEVMARIMTEDMTRPNISLPLYIRRIGYNKYFISLKRTANLVLGVFDTESMFFQDMDPQEHKSLIIFFWPEYFLFVLGLWVILRQKKMNTRFLINLFIGSLLIFCLSDNYFFIKLVGVGWLVAIIITKGMFYLFTNKKIGGKITLVLLLGLTIYGYLTNQYDIYSRVDKWLDNRPIVYGKIYSFLNLIDLEEYKSVVIANQFGPAEKYCEYFLKECRNFEFSNFNLSEEEIKKETLFIGFQGNFLGPKNDNKFSDDIEYDLLNKNIVQEKVFDVHDTIAFRYGNKIIFGRVVDDER